MLTSVCPILPSSDFERTKAFYHRLGFTLAFEYVEQGYLILTRDEIELHFFRAADQRADMSNHGAYVRVADANALSAEFARLGLSKTGFPAFHEAENKPWGLCELAMIDPDGTLLRMAHIL